MNTPSRVAVIAFGAALTLLGLVILFSGGLSLPTRSPSTHFRFAGTALLLLGASPLLAGASALAIAFKLAERDAPAVRWAIGAAMVALALAFVIAPKNAG